MANFDIPEGLESFRKKLEATIKPYIKIKARLTRKVSLWQSKFAGFPYLPKDFNYPKTPEGDYLYLLAQINFKDTPYLEGFPEKGILQFYLAKTDWYGRGWYPDHLTDQREFRILYFPEPDLNEKNLITDFSFLPNLWNNDNNSIPLTIFPSYTPHKNDCFALSFRVGFAPISARDYQFEQLIGAKAEDVFMEVKLWDDYHTRFAVEAHKIGGYPYFTQDDPRELLTGQEKDPYILLLQIKSDSRALGSFQKIHIQWGDVGGGNFFIKESDLKSLDFSEVLYNWDCC